MCLPQIKTDEKAVNGSITVFMSLMLMILASLLFTLLEGSRFIMLGMAAVLNSQSVTESMFAEYNVPTYQQYHLFMMDSGYGSGELLLSNVNARMQQLGQENLNPSVVGLGRYTNFLQMDVVDSSIVKYEIATDQSAGPLIEQAVQVAKQEIGTDIAQQVYQKVTDVKESCEKGKQTDGYLDGALDTLEQAKEAAEEAENGIETKAGIKEVSGIASLSGFGTDSGNIYPEDIDLEVENPMEDVKDAKSSPLLSQVLSDGQHVSAKQISKADAVEQRTLNIGNYDSTHEAGLLDKALVIQYLKKYTSNFRNKAPGSHALSYEQEYLLFGKYTDEDNLKKMAGRLLLVREGMNFAYLLADHTKREQAHAMAATIAAAAGVPVAVSVIEMGLLASWAYAESIVELRTLFSGGKVAAVKSAESWTISLPQAAVVLFQTSVKSKEVEKGLQYEDYLHTFLALENMEKLGSRFANLLEKNIRLYAGYEQVKLDCMVTAMEAEHAYKAQQVFLSMVTIVGLSKKGYQYKETYQFSYLDEK